MKQDIRRNARALRVRSPAEAVDTPSPPVGLLMSGYFKAQPPYGVRRRHGTRDWVLTYTLSGRGLYRQAGVRVEARPGEFVLLEPGAYHDYSCLPGANWEFVWAHFIARPNWAGLMAWPAEGKGLYRLKVPDRAARKRIRAAFFRCHLDACAGQGGLQDELALNGLEEVLLLAARESTYASGERPLSPDIRRVVEALAASMAQRHTVASLARLAGLSPSRFAHRFKEETGDSAIAYLLKLRLRQAARLLEFSGRRVKEVAGEVGFDSPFYFSRQFRKHFSMSPREYMRRTKPEG